MDPKRVAEIEQMLTNRHDMLHYNMKALRRAGLDLLTEMRSKERQLQVAAECANGVCPEECGLDCLYPGSRCKKDKAEPCWLEYWRRKSGTFQNGNDQSGKAGGGCVMSYSSLWVMDNNFRGLEKDVFPNSWLVAPVAWDILLNKYLPPQPGDICIDGKRGFLAASMFDKTLFPRLNKKINESNVQADRVLWELGNQQVFYTKDKEFVAKCLRTFLIENAEDTKDFGEHIPERFNAAADSIMAIDEEKYPYFIWKNTSCDDGVEAWFYECDEEGESCPKSLREWSQFITEFVHVEDGKIVDFTNNQEFFKGSAEAANG